jgi:hypothetical protein
VLATFFNKSSLLKLADIVKKLSIEEVVRDLA